MINDYHILYIQLQNILFTFILQVFYTFGKMENKKRVKIYLIQL